ncbi:MAG: divergent polysaccharide deacetylase family protein, partial [Terracidiphilus sp.]
MKRALAEIARRHKLSLVERPSSDAARFDLTFHGLRTHSIRIVARFAHANPRGTVSPRLAIIIDDLGNDLSSGRSVISLPFPLTVSVLPHLPFSTELADKAYGSGDQVLLHLPMQPKSPRIQAEQSELRIGMDARQVRSALANMLDTVPHVVGVNNHEGSRATSDPALMEALMPALRERGLFFIDSRTAPTTVAYDAAERAGIAAASRKVFLDDSPHPGAIREQLKIAAD